MTILLPNEMPKGYLAPNWDAYHKTALELKGERYKIAPSFRISEPRARRNCRSGITRAGEVCTREL